MNEQKFFKKIFPISSGSFRVLFVGTLKSMYILGTCATQYVIIIIIIQKYD